MSFSTSLLMRIVWALAAAGGTLAAQTGGSLFLYSGNGQGILEQFRTNFPMVVQARAANGTPLPGVAIQWSITQGVGTLSMPVNTTDANGLASTFFVATSLQPGTSWMPATVTASSSIGAVNFVVTTIAARLPGGSLGALPAVQLIQPESRSLSGRAGTTLPAAVQVRVISQSGPLTGIGIPDIGVRIVNSTEPDSPAAQCNGPGGVVLTDSTGFASCDVVLNNTAGLTTIAANAGEFQNSTPFTLQITAGPACNYTLSTASVSIGGAGGTATVNVTTAGGCTWTVVSNSAFITVTSSGSSSGPGNVTFTVAQNAGAARTGSITIAGQTVTISQTAAGTTTPSLLAITSSGALPAGTVGTPYSATLTAAGGTAPYSWISNGILPPGLSLSSSGTLSGTPSAAGNFNFTVTVSDAALATASQSVSVAVNTTAAAGSPTITNTAFPPAVLNQAYKQSITVSGGCVTPFSPTPGVTVSSGALPPGIALQAGSLGYTIEGTPTATGAFSFTLTATDSCGRSSSKSFSLAVNTTGTAPGAVSVSPSGLNFTMQGSVRPADQSVSIQSTVQGTPWTAAVSAGTGGNWLVISGTNSGTTPGQLSLGIAPGLQLAPGTYTANLTVTASGGSVVVPVTLVVTSAPAAFTVSPATLTFTQSGQQTLSVSSPGQTGVRYLATATTSSGGAWLSVTPASGETPGSLTVSANAAGLPVGSYAGLVTITGLGTTTTPQSVVVTLHVATAQIATLTASPGSLAFSFEPGIPPPQAQTVAVSSTGGAQSFTASAATAAGGTWLFVTPSAGSTPLSLSVSVNPLGLLPGTYSGSIRLSYTDPARTPVTVPVTLTIGQPPAAITSITNAASFLQGPVAPGEIVVLFGTGLGPGSLATARVSTGGLIETIVAGTRVLFDGVAAPVIYASATQVAAIVPYRMEGRRTARVEVEYNGVRSPGATVQIADSAPAIFTLTTAGQGAILNQDGTVNSAENPAAPGSVVSIYGTGEGPTVPPGVDGKIAADPLPVPQLPINAEIDGLPADVLYAGGAPGLSAGVFQANVRIPVNVRQGPVSVVIKIGNAQSQAGVTVAVGP